MEYIKQGQRDIPVVAECQVVVAGGGIAGVSAAIAAARNGANVILLEREYGLGGLATLGLISIYLPICDGLGNQAQYGLVEELLRLSIKHGAEKKYPKPWLEGGTKQEKIDTRFTVQYNPVLFALEMERMLADLGVRVLFGMDICGVNMKDGMITEVITESRSGCGAIRCKTAVDATGEAVLCHLSGCETEPYKRNNKPASWYYSLSETGYELHMFGLADLPPDRDSVAGNNNSYQNESTDSIINRRYDGLDVMEVSDLTRDAHQKMYEDIMSRKEKDNSFVPTSMSSIPLLRMTRKLVGEYVMDDTEDKKHFDDSVGLVSDWRKRDKVYELPFRTLYSAKVKNLLAAGRLISVTDAMWEVTRPIPPAAVSGQAAGTAAALGNDMTTIDLALVQKKLVEQGVKLNWEDIYVSD